LGPDRHPFTVVSFFAVDDSCATATVVTRAKHAVITRAAVRDIRIQDPP
jgi:hypothetical protein